jgi:hypothetical protein
MRTSDAERRSVSDFLRDCCAEGRLTPEELEDRLDRLYESATVADIRRLVADLPGGHAVVPRYGATVVWGGPVVPARRPRRLPRGVLPLLGLTIATALFMALPLLVKTLTAGFVLVMLLVGVAIALALTPVVATMWGIAWVASRLGRARLPRP